MFGSGIAEGAVVGATDKLGFDVTGQAYDEQNLFATIFAALGINPHTEFNIPTLPDFHYVEDNSEPIKEVLA